MEAQLVNRPELPIFVEVGDHTYFGGSVNFRSWVSTEKIVIGSYCSIGSDVHFVVGGNHPTDTVSTFPFDNLFLGRENPSRSYRTTKDTNVGHDVWIGAGADIGSGVNIGHGCVVGAKAVVAKDMPPYSVVVGNPARVTRFRFARDQIERLLRLAWWHWPTEKIRNNVEWFYRPVSEFLDKFEAQ